MMIQNKYRISLISANFACCGGGVGGGGGWGGGGGGVVAQRQTGILSFNLYSFYVLWSINGLLLTE